MTDFTAPVSVVIPCFLCRDTIERAVLSVLGQTMMPREILLIDDASPDSGTTVHKMKKLAEQHRHLLSIKVIESSANGGPGSARNIGWKLASQPYVAFLDADDVWFPRKIECQYIWMRDHPDFVLSCHHQVILRDGAHVYDEELLSDNVGFEEIFSKKLLFFNVIATRTVMLKREIPHIFLEEKRYSEDYLLWLNIVLSGGRAAKLVPKLAGAFKPDFGVGGLSSRLIKMEIGELDCYLRVYRNKSINIIILFGATGFSLVKFIRRIIFTAFWKLTCLRRNS